MKNKPISFVAALCAALVLASQAVPPDTGSVVSAANDDTATRIKSLEKDLQGVQAERSAAQKALNKAKSGKSAQIALKEQYDREIVAIDTQLRTTEELIEQYEQSILETQEDIDELIVEQKSQQELFDDMVRCRSNTATTAIWSFCSVRKIFRIFFRDLI